VVVSCTFRLHSDTIAHQSLAQNGGLPNCRPLEYPKSLSDIRNSLEN
jgi:hypothetical protein